MGCNIFFQMNNFEQLVMSLDNNNYKLVIDKKHEHWLSD